MSGLTSAATREEMIEEGLERSRVLARPAEAAARRRMLCMPARRYELQPSAFCLQPLLHDLLNKERRFIPLRLDAYSHEKETGRFPKILIFAVNDVAHISHADQLVKTCHAAFGQGDDFVQKITGNPNVDRPLQRIREFRNRPNPRVVVTVDMLSTGVDIPALEFIVFLRPVKSRILTMLGHGTRISPEINKTKFTVFDCFDGTLIEYFKNTTDFRIELHERKGVTVNRLLEAVRLRHNLRTD